MKLCLDVIIYGEHVRFPIDVIEEKQQHMTHIKIRIYSQNKSLQALQRATIDDLNLELLCS